MKTIRFDAVPADLAAFSQLAKEGMTQPEQVCALLTLALDLYVRDKQAGLAALDLLRGPRPMSPMEAQFVRDRLMDKKYLPLAYFEGGTPANNYTPSLPLTINVYPDPRPQDVQEGYTRRYLRTAGADGPRSITLRRKGDQWFLWEYSGIFLSIRTPAAEDPWA